jgi:hypothetical protein
MQAKADSILGRIAVAARQRPALVHITVPPQLARFLIAAGAQPAQAVAVSSARQPFRRPAGFRWLLRDSTRMLAWRLSARLVSHYSVRPVSANQVGPKILRARVLLRMLDAGLASVSAGSSLADIAPVMQPWEDTVKALESASATARDASSTVPALADVARDITGAAQALGEARIRLLSAIHRADPELHGPMQAAVAEVQRIRAALPAADLSGADVFAVSFTTDDLEGAIWDSGTRWPSADIAAWALAESAEIRPGVYQIGALPDHDVIPAR